jgi:hypothetical protein
MSKSDVKPTGKHAAIVSARSNSGRTTISSAPVFLEMAMGDHIMSNRYYWVSFAVWNAMTPAQREKLEDWAKLYGLEVAVDLRDDHQKEPKTTELEEDVDV